MAQTTPEPHNEHLIAAVTDALVSGNSDFDRVIARYQVSRGDAELIRVIRNLHSEFAGVRPSRQFAHRLHHELMMQGQPGLFNRLRYLPPRVQMAAGVAVLAGFLLLSRRRLSALRDVLELTDDGGDAQEARPTQA